MSCSIRLRSACLILFVPLAACYSYTPVNTPAPGMDVRARLKPDAAVKRSEGLDDAIMRFDGTVTQVTPDALTLHVILARSSSGLQDVVLRDTVRLPTAEIQSITQRQLSVGRTALFVVAVGAAAVGLIKGIEEVVGGTDDTDNIPPPAAVVPVFTRTTRLRLLQLRWP